MWKSSSWCLLGLVSIILICLSLSITTLVVTLVKNQVKPDEDAVQENHRLADVEKELSELRHRLREDELTLFIVHDTKIAELSATINSLNAQMNQLEEQNIINSEKLKTLESRVDLLEKSPLPEEAQSGRRPEPDDQFSQFDQHIDWVHA